MRPARVHAGGSPAKRVLGTIALAALIRTVFYASLDAFSSHLFGDPRPERSGSDRLVSVSRPLATDDHHRIGAGSSPLPQSRVA